MSIARTELQSLPHAVFLHRVAEGPQEKALESRLAQGAFLVLRLVDQLSPSRDRVPPDAFEYQHAAISRFCGELRRTSTEGAHLQELVASAAAAYREADVRLLSPGLFAYAHFLEDALHLEEALDVLGTLREMAGTLSGEDGVALSLRAGRVNRKLNRFDDADDAYANACEQAKGAGDRYSELLGRIGRANTVLGRGNLPEAERRLLGVLADARQASERDAEARAEHGLAAVLQYRGSPDAALLHAWRAFELYDDEDSRLRALNDVGIMMLTLGDAVGAERALKEVVRRGGTRDNVINATIELMHCASFRRDRVSFERHRASCEEAKQDMPPNILTDYFLKAGIGEARFGHFRRAAATLGHALEIAHHAELHAFVFKIERIRNGLDACEAALASESSVEAQWPMDSEALQQVSASLSQLVPQPA